MKRVIVVAVVGCALAGCSGVGSVYPIYSSDDTVSPSSLYGQWKNAESDDGCLVISPGSHGGYRVQFRDDDGGVNCLDMYLTEIGGKLFADVYSGPDSDIDDDSICMPVHLFFKVEPGSGTLKVYSPAAEWFDRHLNQRPTAIHHIKNYAKGEQGWIYLTDGTKKVRSFIRSCAKRAEAFEEAGTLVKVSDSQELPPARAEKKEGEEAAK